MLAKIFIPTLHLAEAINLSAVPRDEYAVLCNVCGNYLMYFIFY